MCRWVIGLCFAVGLSLGAIACVATPTCVYAQTTEVTIQRVDDINGKPDDDYNQSDTPTGQVPQMGDDGFIGVCALVGLSTVCIGAGTYLFYTRRN